MKSITPVAPFQGVPAPSAGRNRWILAGICGAMFAAIFLAYHPALHGDFLWDDDGHVTRPDLRSIAGLGRIWFEIGATQQYYPVLHSAFWLEQHLWGNSVLGYHLLNVLLHATTACLLGVLLRRLAVPGAWLAASLFALHPVCVESVAWISEQKNTLSAVFYLTAALAYLRYEAQRRPGGYALATGWFVLALLTKTVTATLPAALLVILWWKHGRLAWRRDVVPLLPWFVLSVLAGVVTAGFEHELIGARGADFALGPVGRVLLAGRVFWFYLGKLFWPANLTFIYPRWTIDAARAGQWIFPAAGVALLLAAVYAARVRSWGRGLLAALLLFGGTLFPVLGFFNVFPFLYSYVADHFQYLASLPVFAFLGATLVVQGRAALGAVVRDRPRLSWWGAAGVGTLLVVAGGLTWRQAGVYRDVFTLYETTLARNPGCWMAHNNLAIALANAGRVTEAVPHLEAALKLKPDFAQAENNLGDDLVRLGREGEAIPHFERAVQLEPRYAVAHRNLGMALAMGGRMEEAVRHFAQAVQMDPSYAEAESYWAVALVQTGHFSEAVPHFERAIALAPAVADYHVNYAQALAQAGRLDAAVVQFEAALHLDDGQAGVHLDLARVLRRLGRLAEAHEHELAARRLPAGVR